MRVLVACEFTGIVREAFRALGHDAWSCDLMPTEFEPQYHIERDVLEILDEGWDIMIAHPPCTYLSNSGVRHLHSSVESKNGVRAKVSGIEREYALAAAAKFFNTLKGANIPRIAIENPIPSKYAKALIGEYDQLIQPWQFGHGETKATCLWLKDLPRLVPTELCIGRDSSVSSEPDSSGRAERRSRTFPGIAVAMAYQWGVA